MQPSKPEYFDVVNERDEVIGKELRAVVHAQALWHRAVHILIFNAEGQLYLQKRSAYKDTSPGLWDSSCSGHVDAGEEYDEAAQREVHEELGIVVPVPPRWFRIDACAQTGWEFVWVYRLRHEGPFILNRAEIDYGNWFSVVDLTEQLAREPGVFAPPFRLIWARAVMGF